MDSRRDREGLDQYMTKHGYVMGKIVGEGSYSKVKYVIRNFPNGTPAYKLACKIIDKKKASEEFVKKFLPRELQIMTRLDHPNIIRVFDIVEFDRQVYLFMDLCDKGDLLEYIKSKGSLSEARSRLYFQQLLSAVNYLHSLDLAHRDLKCENVLLGAKDSIKISDFGFARYCRDESGKRILSNTYCGSAAYAAPEILQGTSYNPKLYDMWSIGCVLFIMLTGHMPFDESNIPKMLQYQLERKLVYPNGMEEELSEAPKSLIKRLLEPDVTRRSTVAQAWNHTWLTMGFRPNSAPNSEGGSQFIPQGVTGGGDTSKVLKYAGSTSTTAPSKSQARSSALPHQPRRSNDENYPPNSQFSSTHPYGHRHQLTNKSSDSSSQCPSSGSKRSQMSQKIKPRFTTGKYTPQTKLAR